MAYGIPRLPCGCPANEYHTCGSGARHAVQVHLEDERWREIARARLEQFMATVPSDLHGGYATVTFQWEARPGVWPE